MNSLYQIIIFVSVLHYPILGQDSTERSSLMYSGVIAQSGDVPYHVSFKKRDTREKSKKYKRFVTFCGGAIITRVKILSIAYCFNSTEIAASGCQGCYAVAGTIRNIGYHTIKRMSHEQWRHILKVEYPRDFSSDDIVMVTINRTLIFNNFVKAVRFGSKSKDYSGYCNISGYSKPSFGLHSDSLLVTRVFMMPQHECDSSNHEDMSNYICAVSEIPYGTLVIERDINSGSPLVCQYDKDVNENEYPGLLVGLMTESNSLDGYSSIFTKLSSQQRFIENDVMKFLESEDPKIIEYTETTTEVSSDLIIVSDIPRISIIN